VGTVGACIVPPEVDPLEIVPPGVGAPEGLPGVRELFGPFSEGACDCTKGVTFGELPIAVGQGKDFGPSEPPIKLLVRSCRGHDSRQKEKGSEEDAGCGVGHGGDFDLSSWDESGIVKKLRPKEDDPESLWSLSSSSHSASRFCC
jgi:hypothetical protein